MNDSSFRHILIVFGLTFGILLILSALPLSRISGNLIKDFNLFEDLFPQEYRTIEEPTPAAIDPELAELIAEAEAAVAAEACDTAKTLYPAEEKAEVAAAPAAVPEPLAEAPVSNGIVCLENYTGVDMLQNFKASVSAGSLTRVAVIGDSFIEGDIFCQDLRDMLQERFGGCGVGHLSLHSDLPGFRKSVRQSDNCWEIHDIRTMAAGDSLRTLSGDYCTASSTATTTLHGTDFSAHTGAWDNTSLTFIAPAAGTVTLRTDAGEQTFAVEASAEPRTVSLAGRTSTVKITSAVPGLKALGVRLDPAAGVQVDCMPIRGNSGIAHRRLNTALCTALRESADYSLIVVEYGINALSAEQTDYTPYRIGMEKVINRIKQAYPKADILIMGISDRGSKDGTNITSLPTCAAMVNAQRRLARECGAMFWDSRAAMGGAGACADWRKRKLMNADYIHLNHAGGRELATLLYNAISEALK